MVVLEKLSACNDVFHISGTSEVVWVEPAGDPILLKRQNGTMRDLIAQRAPEDANAYTCSEPEGVAIPHPLFGGRKIFVEAIAIQYYKIID